MPSLSTAIANPTASRHPGAAMNSGKYRRCVPWAVAFRPRYGLQVCGEPTTGSDH
jgi:hypothetical protein